MATRFLQALHHQPPDAIIATHFFPVDVAATARRSGRYGGPVVAVITDLFPHRLWLAQEADAVVVGAESTKALCAARGIEPARVHVLGIPVSARFAQPVDRHEVLGRLGLDPARRMVLVTSGGMGVGQIAELVGRLVYLERRRALSMQIVVVCGHNQHLAQQLQAAHGQDAMPIRVFGFVETMPELMGACDLLVTKAGGLTVMEALARGLPMVLSGTIPGQEEYNASYVLRAGAAIDARTPKEAVAEVERLLTHPEALGHMRECAARLGTPHAAEAVVELTEQLMAASTR